MVQQPLVDQDLNIEVSRLHSDTPHSVGLLSTSDQPDTEHRDLYLTSQNTDKREISMPRQDSNPQSQQTSGRRPTP